jgi:hypothetical protein
MRGRNDRTAACVALVVALTVALTTAAPACVSVPEAAPLQFAIDDDQLRDGKSERELDTAVQALRDDPDLHVLIVGHADEDNTDEYNRELSRRRAVHVRERILALAPELDDRIRVQARSEWDASAVGDDERAKTRNRRVELHFHYPRRCEPSFDSAFLACEWARLPPPTPPAAQVEPAPTVPPPSIPPPAPSVHRKQEFLGPFVFGQVGYAIASSEYLRQYVRWSVGAGYLWGFDSDFRIGLGLEFDHLIDVGFVYPQSGPCAPFCNSVDHSRIRVVPELRLGGAKGGLWGWVRLSGGLLLQHREATRRFEAGEPTMIVAPQHWDPGGVMGIGPGIAVALTDHLFLLFDGMVTYARVPAVDRGGGGIDIACGLGWVC